MSEPINQVTPGFTERLQNTMKLVATAFQQLGLSTFHLCSAKAYKSTHVDLSLIEIQDKARSAEEGFFKMATSIEDYRRLSQIALASIQPLPASSQHVVDPSSSLCPVSNKGHQIGPYQSVSYHRSGLFSTVFKTQDPSTRAIIALKVTELSRILPPHDVHREARILRKAKHTHIISLLSVFYHTGSQHVLAFPFMLYDLEVALHQHILQPADIRSHLHDLFSALSHLHSLGIIHRDIKPSNILLNSLSGPAYLADFGIAWMKVDEDSEPTEQKITDVGTTSYRPPELLFGYTEYNSSIDLWAAGCVVAEVVSGGEKTLFDAGPLGTELALIQSIFKTLGTPTSATWEEANNFPDWGKMNFVDYSAKPWVEILSNTDDNARDLVSRLVRYQSKKRLGATKASIHR